MNLYAGIAEGAFSEARSYTLEQARPWFTSNAPSSAEDPFIQHNYGELRVRLRSAQVLADVAGELVDRHFPKGAAITVSDRGETAIAIADAKVAAHHAALDISSRLFDVASTTILSPFPVMWLR